MFTPSCVTPVGSEGQKVRCNVQSPMNKLQSEASRLDPWDCRQNRWGKNTHTKGGRVDNRRSSPTTACCAPLYLSLLTPISRSTASSDPFIISSDASSSRVYMYIVLYTSTKYYTIRSIPGTSTKHAADLWNSINLTAFAFPSTHSHYTICNNGTNFR